MDHYNHIVTAVAVSVFLAGCSPRIVEKVRTEYITETVHHRDTTYSRDSIYIREWMKGDTVYLDRYRDRYIYRDRWKDSVKVVEVHDTTAIRVKVDKPLSVVQKAKIGAFWWLFTAVILLLAWTFRKPVLAILKKWTKL